MSSVPGLSTLSVHEIWGQHIEGSHVMPIFQTSTYVFEDPEEAFAVFKGQREGYIYTRLGHPNADEAAQRIALLEAYDFWRENPDADPKTLAYGRLYPSGMAAITAAFLAAVKPGQTVVAQHRAYGTTYRLLTSILPRWDIRVHWVRDLSPEGWARALEEAEKPAVVYAETPSNPTLDIVDLEMVARLAHEAGARVLVDNTFATPYTQRPLTWGVDIVVHSTTKYLVGHGVVVGGAVVTRDQAWFEERLVPLSRTMGFSVAPFDAWLTQLGLKTFALRMARHNANAQALAEFLQSHPKVHRVRYPGLPEHPGHAIARKQMVNGFGGVVSFEVKGGAEAALAFIARVRLASLGVSLGNVDSLIQHPATMTHRKVPQEEQQAMGITPGLIRFSVGIEDVEDLIRDIDQALQAVP